MIITDELVFTCCKNMKDAVVDKIKKAQRGQLTFTDDCIRANDEALGVDRNWNARRSLEEGRDLTHYGANGISEVMMMVQLQKHKERSRNRMFMLTNVVVWQASSSRWKDAWKEMAKRP